MYSCPGGMDFASSFSDDGDEATLRMPGQPAIELVRVPAGSGFAYSDSYYELRGRGREVTLTAAGRSMRCHAAGRPGEPPRTFDRRRTARSPSFPDGTFRLREKRDGAAEPVLELGQWAQEVEGGVRLVILRGGDGDLAARLPRGRGSASWSPTEGSRAHAEGRDHPTSIDGRFRLSGLYRDAQDGGLFARMPRRAHLWRRAGRRRARPRAGLGARRRRRARASLYVEVDRQVHRSGTTESTVDRIREPETRAGPARRWRPRGVGAARHGMAPGRAGRRESHVVRRLAAASDCCAWTIEGKFSELDGLQQPRNGDLRSRPANGLRFVARAR
jgi:hypothetical protein